MSKKKKNKSAGPSAEEKAQMVRHYNRFRDRIEFLCKALAGEGYYEKIPAGGVQRLYSIRYPAIKAKAAAGSEIQKSKIIQFNKLLHQFLEDYELDLGNGNKVLLGWFLSEGLLLVNFISALEDFQFSHAMELKEAFSVYFPNTESHEILKQHLLTVIEDVTVFLSDLNHSILKADVSNTACFNLYNSCNDILVHEFKTEKTTMLIDGETRSVYPLRWISERMEPIHAKVSPSHLGFQTGSLDIPLEVYIQQHALDRLQERLDITPGIMHSIAFLIFGEPVIKHRKMKNHSLVEFPLSDQKAGYLLVTLTDGKLLIRTFLFLTNDNTPEGEKLRQLLEVQKEDKKYLMIDKLSTFNSYHIDQNEKLSKLFSDAGCGSLLKLGHLKEFSRTAVEDKDPESILKYLANAEYFVKKNDN